MKIYEIFLVLALISLIGLVCFSVIFFWLKIMANWGVSCGALRPESEVGNTHDSSVNTLHYQKNARAEYERREERSREAAFRRLYGSP